MTHNTTIAVVGLGYVGLPLAVEFGKKYPTIGFDLSTAKISAYRKGVDPTGEVLPEELLAAGGLRFTTDATDLRESGLHRRGSSDASRRGAPARLRSAARCEQVGGSEPEARCDGRFRVDGLSGRNEEICIPVIEQHSGAKWKRDFFVGYSPERINPGDREHSLTRITKVVSGDTPETLERVASVYGSIITAGVYRASSISVAEAAKVIENTQRDLNIALMNELALLFHKIGIDTKEVLDAAGTKWNFLPFRPGLVGGHCIGVDPYYLTHKADKLGYHPQVILAGAASTMVWASTSPSRP